MVVETSRIRRPSESGQSPTSLSFPSNSHRPQPQRLKSEGKGGKKPGEGGEQKSKGQAGDGKKDKSDSKAADSKNQDQEQQARPGPAEGKQVDFTLLDQTLLLAGAVAFVSRYRRRLGLLYFFGSSSSGDQSSAGKGGGSSKGGGAGPARGAAGPARARSRARAPIPAQTPATSKDSSSEGSDSETAAGRTRSTRRSSSRPEMAWLDAVKALRKANGRRKPHSTSERRQGGSPRLHPVSTVIGRAARGAHRWRRRSGAEGKGKGGALRKAIDARRVAHRRLIRGSAARRKRRSASSWGKPI